jgi:hypothetical protein
VSNNGGGKEEAHYIRVEHNCVTVLLVSDAMEKEDANFIRDLVWIPNALRMCYEYGKIDQANNTDASF